MYYVIDRPIRNLFVFLFLIFSVYLYIFSSIDIEFQKNYHIIYELRTIILFPLYLTFVWMLIKIGQYINLIKTWHNSIRDIIIVVILSFISTKIITTHLPVSILSSLITTNVFIIVIFKTSSELKRTFKIKRRKKELSIYDNKLKLYAKIPAEKGDLIKYVYQRECGTLIIDKYYDDLSIHELNYNLPDNLYPLAKNKYKSPSMKKLYDPTLIIVLEKNSNEYYYLEFIDYKRSLYLGRIVINQERLYSYNDDADEKSLKLFISIEYLIHNLDKLFTIRYLNPRHMGITDIIDRWENGEIKYKGKYDYFNSYNIDKSISYYENGNVHKKGEYSNGLKDGRWSEYYEDGNIKKISYYSGGWETIEKEYWNNGVIKFELVTKYSKILGSYTSTRFYDEEGNLTKES